MLTSKEIEKISNGIVEKLKEENLIRTNHLNTYQKTERLLYNYIPLKKIVENKEKRINEIREEGIIKSGTPNETRAINREFKSDLEKIEEKINNFYLKVESSKGLIRLIEEVLKTVKSDKYFQILELRYQQGKKFEEIAEILDIGLATVSRNKNRLINKLKLEFFPEEAARELY